MSTLWCGDPSAHGRHEWIGHHGRRMDCPGDDGTRGTLRDAIVIRRIDGDHVPPVDGVPYTDAQGYSRMRITERAWAETREVGEIAGIPVLTFGIVTGPALSGEVVDLAPPELPDAWTRILELGERSAARLQPADACGGGDPLVDEPVGAAAPLTTRAGSGGTRERRSVDHDQEVETMQNPNEYDDEAYAVAAEELRSALIALWAAGASRDNIEAEFEGMLPEVVT